MAKGKYTRKEAGIKAYSEVTGEELPPRVNLWKQNNHPPGKLSGEGGLEVPHE